MADDDAPRLPVTLRVSDRRVVVVGGDFYGLKIARLFTDFGAIVRVIGGADAQPAYSSAAGPFEFEPRGYVRGDLVGADIAVCTANEAELRNAVRAEADSTGCLLYVSGAPHLSDFIIDAYDSEAKQAEGESS